MMFDGPSLGWGLLLVAAFAGWGHLARRAVLPKAPGEWGLDAAWGVVFTVLLGGVANLLHLYSRPAVVGYVLLGSALCGWHIYRHRTVVRMDFVRRVRLLRSDRLLLGLLLVVVAIVSLRYVAAPVRRSYLSEPTFSGMPFNMHDDMQSYLVMPEKMLQLGHLAPDPFNTRQLEATLGGMHVLNALGRAVLPFERLHVVEEGAGLIVFCGALAALLRALQLSPRGRLLLLLLALGSFEPNLNLSSYLSAAAVMSALMVLLLEPDPQRFLSLRWSVALGLLLAGATALKSTVFPVAGVLVGATILARWLAPRDWRVLRAAGVAAIVLIVTLLPWMVLKQQTYGTPFFPLLGKGNHWTNYCTPPDDASQSTWQVFLRQNLRNLPGPLVAAAIGTVLFALPAVRRRMPAPESCLTGGVVASWLVNTFALGLAGGGFPIARYLSPLTLTGVPLMAGVTWKLVSGVPIGSRRRAVLVLAWCLPVAGWIWIHHRDTVVYLSMAVSDDLRSKADRYPIASDTMRGQAARMQARVPAGADLLLRCTHPFLFDFRRNRIFVADWPGAVAPDRMMPVFEGAEDLAKYLLAHEIRYVGYSYANECLFPLQNYWWRMGPDQPKWERQVALLTFNFQANLTQLGVTRRRVYDDGINYVIDLATYSGNLPRLQIEP